MGSDHCLSFTLFLKYSTKKPCFRFLAKNKNPGFHTVKKKSPRFLMAKKKNKKARPEDKYHPHLRTQENLMVGP